MTTAIVTATVSATEETVVMLGIAHLIISITEGMVIAHTQLTLMSVQVALIVVWTVGIVLQTSTARLALAGAGITVVAVAIVWVSAVSHVAHPIKHVTLGTLSTATQMVSAAGGVRVGTIDTVSANSRTS